MAKTVVYTESEARDAVKEYPAQFRRLADDRPAAADHPDMLESALSFLFADGHTAVQLVT